jgi:hypothetical protein
VAHLSFSPILPQSMFENLKGTKNLEASESKCI